MFESCESLIEGAAILYLAVCINDSMNKANMCGKSINCVTSQPLSALRW